jgi:fructuronate reductase
LLKTLPIISLNKPISCKLIVTERLSNLHLFDLAPKVVKPKYKISEHKPGIVHIGIGAFHRGHQAVFTDDAIANSGGDWRIIGVSLRSSSVAHQLNPQNGLYTLTTKHNSQVEHRLIGSIDKVLVAPDNPRVVTDTIAMPSIKVITLTVTEKGYHYDLATQALDLNSPDIQHDIEHPDSPVSMPGFIVAGCAKRSGLVGGVDSKREHSKLTPPKLTIISCDNLPENGKITRTVVLSLAQKISTELAEWISANVSFCSSMVDRIVPAVNDEHRADIAKSIGLRDEGMIQTEPFKQWVIEDNFADNSTLSSVPDWASAGALIVSNVESYERLKLRTLNGSHSALAYMGVLLGFTWIHEAVNDSLLGKIVKQMMVEESGPSLITPVGFDLATYQQDIIERFQNDQIPYATQQVAMDGSQKMVQRIFAPIIDHIDQSDDIKNDKQLERAGTHKIKILTTVIASWLLYLRGETEQGESYSISDPLGDKLQAIVKANQEPASLLDALFSQTSVFPNQLTQNKAFVDLLTLTLHRIQQNGLREHLIKIA